MNKIKILIIEDEAIVALDIKRILISLGHEVINTAFTFEEALKNIKENRPELIFSDINLGKDRDGIELRLSLHNGTKCATVLKYSLI